MTKSKTSERRTVRGAGSKPTEKKSKNSLKEYREAMRAAYNLGYNDGWRAHEDIPKKAGARMAAKVGYSNGMRAHKKSDKYQAKAQTAARARTKRG